MLRCYQQMHSRIVSSKQTKKCCFMISSFLPPPLTTSSFNLTQKNCLYLSLYIYISLGLFIVRLVAFFSTLIVLPEANCKVQATATTTRTTTTTATMKKEDKKKKAAGARASWRNTWNCGVTAASLFSLSHRPLIFNERQKKIKETKTN